ncbi:MAG: orotidine-5'-phosphate decarboxylase [Promethearchaeota archaeon]
MAIIKANNSETEFKSFRKILFEKIKEKRSVICVGLDPDLSSAEFPKFLIKDYDKPKLEFAKRIIDAVYDKVAVVKPNTRFYRPNEWEELRDIVKYAHSKGLIVIGDCKENDIGNTMARAYYNQFNFFNFDAITINGYFGANGVIGDKKNKIFNKWYKEGRGLFVLVKTSNPSSSELQDIQSIDGTPFYIKVAEAIERWNTEIDDYDWSIGAVVGATHPAHLKRVREVLNGPLLLPGYGAQGASAEDIISGFIGGKITIVNSGRQLMYAYLRKYKGSFSEEEFDKATSKAVKEMNRDLEKHLKISIFS